MELAKTPSIVVHHLNNSRSQRILWLLEELELDYSVKRYERDPKTLLAPPELKAIHPLGHAPVVTCDGITLAESGLIMEYILEKFGNGKLVPKSDENKLKMKYYFHYSEGSLQPPLLLNLIFAKIRASSMPFFARPIANKICDSVENSYINPNVKSNLDFLENELSKSTWFAGPEISAADIMLSYPLEASDARVGNTERPNIKRFIQSIRSRPAYIRALEKGGDKDYGQSFVKSKV